MSSVLSSTQAQQNFGAVMDRVLREDAVIIERYGAARVVIVQYDRYRQLVDVEQAFLRQRLQQASAAVSARAATLSEQEVTDLIEQARSEVFAEVAAEASV
jgi:PHD/YefM family antitoxin component YafN of YafNO toxin-antitoxin module